ncbi:hypothetical protein HAX54_037705, partial [Datura stramonium]|nr:hypothetical protein [Datura stramonium]
MAINIAFHTKSVTKNEPKKVHMVEDMHAFSSPHMHGCQPPSQNHQYVINLRGNLRMPVLHPKKFYDDYL